MVVYRTSMRAIRKALGAFSAPGLVGYALWGTPLVGAFIWACAMMWVRLPKLGRAA